LDEIHRFEFRLRRQQSAFGDVGESLTSGISRLCLVMVVNGVPLQFDVARDRMEISQTHAQGGEPSGWLIKADVNLPQGAALVAYETSAEALSRDILKSRSALSQGQGPPAQTSPCGGNA
jgi:hypothetical protein